MTIRLNPPDYAEMAEWRLEDWQKECCRLSAFGQQQQHLIDHLSGELLIKDQEIKKFQEKIKHLKFMAGRIVLAAEPAHTRVKAGSTSTERLSHIYAGGQDD